MKYRTGFLFLIALLGSVTGLSAPGALKPARAADVTPAAVAAGNGPSSAPPLAASAGPAAKAASLGPGDQGKRPSNAGLAGGAEGASAKRGPVDGKASATAPLSAGKALAAVHLSPPDADGAGRAARTPGRAAFEATRDGSFADPESWFVIVYKSRHQLAVYYQGRLYQTYRAVFGRRLEGGPKLWAGDRRTPEGVYFIVHKYRSPRFTRFLRINYPNAGDRQRYYQMRRSGLVPVVGRRPAALGGAIGIHGTDQPILNAGNINWTTGCISLDNAAILELDRRLPVGTLVIIKP